MSKILTPYIFNTAIARRPAKSVVKGLRDGEGLSPTYQGVKGEHDYYLSQLDLAGVNVTILPPLEAFPDAMFVEDPALVFPDGAILLRTGAESRAAETAKIAPIVRYHFQRTLEIDGEGFVEGGDVLVTPKGIMIGLSGRTNQEGAKALQTSLETLGYDSKIVETPENVLHFKTDCSLIDGDCILTTNRLAKSGVFDGFEQVLIPEGEEAAANALRVNDVLFVGDDFPETIELLDGRGYNVVPMPTTQIGRIDAGLSCMSLRWQRDLSRL